MTVAVAAILFALVAVVVIGFQVALALGAPWGAYAMGGSRSGRFPPAMRVGALVQAGVIAAFVLIVLSHAGFVLPSLSASLPWLIWLPVAFSGVSVVLNAITRSSVERRIWLPVAIVMLVCNLVVALS